MCLWVMFHCPVAVQATNYIANDSITSVLSFLPTLVSYSSSEFHFDRVTVYKTHHLGNPSHTLGIQQLPDGGFVIFGKETYLCFTYNVERVREWSAGGGRRQRTET